MQIKELLEKAKTVHSGPEVGSSDYHYLDNFSFLPEGGRIVHYYLHYLIVQMYALDDPFWDFRLTAVGIVKNKIVRWYYVESEGEEFKRHLLFCKEKPGLLQEKKERAAAVREFLVKQLSSFDYTRASSEELVRLCSYYYNGLTQIIRFAGFLRLVDRGLHEYLSTVFSEAGEVDIKGCVNTLFSTTKSCFFMQEEEVLLELGTFVKKEGLSLDSAVVAEKLKDVESTFGFGGMGYYNEKPYSFEHYRKKLKEICLGDPCLRLEEIKKKRSDLGKKQEEIISSLAEEHRELAKLAGELPYEKDYYKVCVDEVIFYGERLFTCVAERFGKDVGVLKDLAPHEMIALLQGEYVDWEGVEKRALSNVLIASPKGFYVLLGEGVGDFEGRYLSSEDVSGAEEEVFNGRVACKGVGVGPVRVVLGQDDFGKVCEGDILVVINTSPDFVPLLEKVSGIIAEEGGLTSHVSVISREFNIPSIIGVAGITDKLKDGETVEVNADKGIVRKV